MKPPVCSICGSILSDESGGLVHFSKRPSDIEWDKKAEENGFTGHPPLKKIKKYNFFLRLNYYFDVVILNRLLEVKYH